MPIFSGALFVCDRKLNAETALKYLASPEANAELNFSDKIQQYRRRRIPAVKK